MPKLEHDEEDFDPSTHTLSVNAQQSLANKLGTGGTTTPSTPTSFTTPGQSTFNPGTAFSQPNSQFSSGAGTNPFGTSSSTFGNSTTSFGSSNAPAGVAGGGTTTLETDSKFGDFINSRWRPMMAVIYMITCTTDFVIFPVLWSVLQAMSHGTVTSQWQPLTLQGAGLYHIAMGAVLGLAAYGRSQEKIAGKA
jgi:hypothetical protein